MLNDSASENPSNDDRLIRQAGLSAPLYLPQVEVESGPFRYSLKGLLLGVTILVCAIAFITWLVRQAALERRNIEIRNALRQAFLSVKSFEDARQRFPSAVYTTAEGQALNSWRFQIAPYWGVNTLGREYYNAAWDDPINAEPRSWDFYIFCTSVADPTTTNVFAISGLDTAFEVSEWPGASKYRSSDVPSNLIMLMEAADSKTHWMQPGDYEVAKLLVAAGRLGDTVKGLLPDRIHVLFADGEVWALSPDTPIDAVKPFFTITDAKTALRDDSLSRYRVDN